MRLAYLLILYNKPDQFRWLLDAIYDEDDVFVVHFDSKTAPDVEAECRALLDGRRNVILLDSALVTWGGWSLSDVVVRGIRRLLKDGVEFDYLINLSAQDYPLVSRARLLAELARSPRANYVYLRPLTAHPLVERMISFLHTRLRWREEAGRMRPVGVRRAGPFTPRYRGSFFVLLTRPFCQWLVTHPAADEAMRYYQTVYLPDLYFIPDLIMRSPFRDTAVHHRRFTLWKKHSPHPRILRSEHLDQLLASGAFFARKFDARIDDNVLVILRDRLKEGES